MARKAKEDIELMDVAEAKESSRATTRIQINKDYILCIDKYSMWIEEYRKTRSKKNKDEESEVWVRVAGYCGTLEGLIVSFTRNKIRTIEAKDVETFLKSMDAIQKETVKLATDIVKKVKNIDLCK